MVYPDESIIITPITIATPATTSIATTTSVATTAQAPSTIPSTSPPTTVTSPSTTVSPQTTSMSISSEPITDNDTVIIEAPSSAAPNPTSSGTIIINTPSNIDSVTSLSNSVNSNMGKDDYRETSITPSYEGFLEPITLNSTSQIALANRTLVITIPNFQDTQSSLNISIPLSNNYTRPIFGIEIPRITIVFNNTSDLSEPIVYVNISEGFEIEVPPDKNIENSTDNFLAENIDLSHTDIWDGFGTISTTITTSSPSMEYRSFNQQSKVYMFSMLRKYYSFSFRM